MCLRLYKLCDLFAVYFPCTVFCIPMHFAQCTCPHHHDHWLNHFNKFLFPNKQCSCMWENESEKWLEWRVMVVNTYLICLNICLMQFQSDYSIWNYECVMMNGVPCKSTMNELAKILNFRFCGDVNHHNDTRVKGLHSVLCEMHILAVRFQRKSFFYLVYLWQSKKFHHSHLKGREGVYLKKF